VTRARRSRASSRRRATILAACFGLSVAVTLAPAAAHAKEPTPDEVDRARTFFNAGAQAYSAARYADAARSFAQAYELAPRPQLAFSLAQAERKEYFAGNDPAYLRRAIQHYKEYLEQVPTGGRRSEATEAKADLEARLARLDPRDAAATAPSAPDKRVARVTVYSATPGARASLDGAPPEELPFFHDLSPGKHRVRVSAEGYFDEEREVSGDRLVDQPLDLPLKERPCVVTIALDRTADVYVDGRIVATTPVSRPVEIPPGPHVISVSANGKRAYSADVVLPRGKPYRFEPRLETSGQRVVAYSMLGVGGAAIVTGAVFGVLALGQEGRVSDIDEERAQGNISKGQLDDYNGAIDRRDSFRDISIVTMSAGAAVALGGAFLYLLDKPPVAVVPPRTEEPSPPRRDTPIDVTAFPMLGPGGWGGGVLARF